MSIPAPSGPRAVVELWFDFSCPYAYLASQRADALAREAGADLVWRPMLLGGVFRGIGAGDGPMATLSAVKARHNLRDMQRWAAQFGVPFAMPAGHPFRTVRALRTLLGLAEAQWPAAIAALFAAYWQRGEDVSTDEVIARALTGAGIDPTAALAGADDPAIKDALRERTDQAIALGVFGAPAWLVRPVGRPPVLVWGQDRLPWVSAILAGWDPEAGPPPGGPRPVLDSASSAPRARPDATLDVYFDVASPFAYLALTQLAGLAAATGVTPRLQPILLGALFRDVGQVDVPLFAFPPPKLRYVGLELPRWSRWWGVPFAQPRKFPQRTVTAQRLALLAAREPGDVGLRTSLALARLMWVEGGDLEDPAQLAALLAREGLPADWLARTQDPATKAALTANTTAAREVGAFGVPTFVVDGDQLFWGQDRLALVAQALAVPGTA